MLEEVPESLQAERLMTHMRVLCEEIGPRPPTSAKERQAADYVKQALADLGVENVHEQPFKSQASLGWVSIPYYVAAILAMLLIWLLGLWGKLVAGLTWLGGVLGSRDLLLAKPPFFQLLIARGDSQNVIATIPPAEGGKRRVYLVGHLDTNRQRSLVPLSWPAMQKPTLTLSMLVFGVGGLSLVVDALRRRREISWWQRLMGLIPLGALFGMVKDELQSYIEGANDNATAVSILLGVAEALQAEPLQHTEVTLLFTGCEEVACVGMEQYLETFASSRENTYWIDLEMVGTGGLCYVTKHGMSYLSEYRPAPAMVALAARAAQKHPALVVSGKDMLILEEVACLVRHGYKAVCITGYNEAGFLPNWHRAADNLENIDPGTLSRAAQYTWALVREIDAL